MKIIKYYIVRLKHFISEELHNEDGSRIEFDTVGEARKKIEELETKNKSWLIGWKKEWIEI